MPINVPTHLPAVKILSSENIFAITQDRAHSQDIRPLEIAIVNLMPTKIATETQLLRLLANTPLQVEITLVQMDSHDHKNTSQDHLDEFYCTFNEIRGRRFDGLVITGAPVETMGFTEVNYWDELCAVMKWSKTNVFNTLHICWGAQAGLYYHYGIDKYEMGAKLSGVYKHKVLIPSSRLMRGFDSEFYAPHSRYTAVSADDIISHGLSLMATSPEAGVYIAATQDRKQVFVTGHSEYDMYTLDGEYRRDIAKGLLIKPPANYYENDDPGKPPMMRWRAHAHLLFANWLNYYVYQETPYNIETI